MSTDPENSDAGQATDRRLQEEETPLQTNPIHPTAPTTQPQPPSMLDAALAYAAAGLSIIPVSQDKRPTVPSWQPYQKVMASTDEIRRWMAAGGNVAVVCGAVSGNLLVIDFDSERLYPAWRQAVGALADGLPVQKTGRGYHVFLRTTTNYKGDKLAWEADVNEPSGRRIAVETRGDGNYAIVAPSRHANGRVYTVVAGDLTQIPTLPAADVDALLQAARDLDECPFTRQEQAKMTAGKDHKVRGVPRNGESVIDRFNQEFLIEDILAEHGYRVLGDHAVRPGGGHKSITIQGNRSFHHNSNDELCDGYWHRPFSVFCQLGHGGDVRAAVKAAAAKLGMAYSGGRPPSGPDEPPSGAGGGKPTDDELRDRWLDRCPTTAFGLGEFYRYGAGVWTVVDRETIKREIAEVLEEAKPEGVKPTANRVDSVLELARVKIAVPAQDWNASPDILVLKNGTLELDSLSLRAHSPSDYVTSGLCFDYDPAAVASAWKKFLAATLPNEADFLQEFAGYALTTDTRHEIALLLVGSPGSGKSTFIEGLMAAAGGRVLQLGLADLDRSRFALTGLVGKTLAVSTEQPGGGFRSSHLLNQLISGEIVTVDRKFRDPVDVRSTVKIVWALNELLDMDAGNGLSRRLKIVRFPNRAGAVRDPQIKEAIKTEGQGILNWMLEGLGRLRARGGFQYPVSVQDATADFLAESDAVAAFVSDACNADPGFQVAGGTLYYSYQAWCKAQGGVAKSNVKFADHLRRLGFRKNSVNGRAIWHGLQLK